MRSSLRRAPLRTLAVLATVALLPGLVAQPASAEAPVKGWPAPIDGSTWENQDHMTWDDYRKPPGTNWADPALKPTKRTFKGAVVLADYPDQEFAVTQPAHSTVFGNPGPPPATSRGRTSRSSTRTSSTNRRRSTAATPSTNIGWRTPAAGWGST